MTTAPAEHAVPVDSLTAGDRLAIGLAPAAQRAALTTLFALDRRLGGILRTTREPIVGQLRLGWWREALTALDPSRPPPAEPILSAIHALLLSRGIDGERLAGMIDGWETIVGAAEIDRATLLAAADARGTKLFQVGAHLLGVADAQVAVAGRGWALADFAGGLSDPAAVRLARDLARDALVDAERRWSRSARPLGALVMLARADIAETRPGRLHRAARLFALRVTGF